MANEVNNFEDIIDSRDVIARIEELESDISSWEEDIEEHQSEISDMEEEISVLEDEAQELDDEKDADEIERIENEIDALNSDIGSVEDNISSIRSDITEAEEDLAPIKNLAEQAEGYSADWSYGEALIRDSYFVDYAMQLAEDIGAIDANDNWPNTCIDWDRAARELQMDYTCVDFEGVEYWIR